MDVTFKTPKKNKEILLNTFVYSDYYNELEQIPQKRAKDIIDKICLYTNLKAKQDLNESITINDLFDNPNEVKQILDKYFAYPRTPDASSKYCSYSCKMNLTELFSNYKSIQNVFIKENEEEIILMLRETNLL